MRSYEGRSTEKQGELNDLHPHFFQRVYNADHSRSFLAQHNTTLTRTFSQRFWIQKKKIVS